MSDATAWWVLTWVGAVLALLALAKVLVAPPTRDTQRLFTTEQRLEIARRAGGRCEATGGVGRRCPAPGSQADHVYPWSKGGYTIVSNGQWLCAKDNNLKRATIPSPWYRWRLERRRRGYFPPGSDVRVSWRLPAR